MQTSFDHVENVVQEIANRFSCSYPSKEGWDENRYFDDIKLMLPTGWEIWNLTDFNYGFSNHYLIAPKQKNESREYYDYAIGFEVSFILDAYYTSIHKIPNKKTLNLHVQSDLKYQQACTLAETLREFIHSKGFFEIHDSWLNVPVENVRLELSEHPNIYNCLFDDNGKNVFR